MRSLICLFVVSLVFFNESQCSSETGRMVKFLLGENNLLNCISDFNEDCINSYGKGSIEKLLVQPEIPLDSHFSLERIGDAEHRNGGGIKNLWSLTEISNTIERFMKDHALKIQFGNMVGRVFESRSKPDNLEFTIDAVGRRRGDDDDDDDDDEDASKFFVAIKNSGLNFVYERLIPSRYIFSYRKKSEIIQGGNPLSHGF